MYLLVSKYGDSLPVLYKAFKNGLYSKAFVRNVNCRRKLKGIIPKVNTMTEGLEFNPELVIFDDVGNGNMADRLRKQRSVFGGSILCDKLHYDPEFCDKKMKDMGFTTKELKGDTSRITFGQRYNKGKYVDSCAFASTESYYPMNFGDFLEGMCVLGWRNDDKEYLDVLHRIDFYVSKHGFTGILYLQFLTNCQKELSFVGIHPYLDKNFFNCHATLYSNIFDLDDKPTDVLACTLRVTTPPYPTNLPNYNDSLYDTIKDKIVGNIVNIYVDDMYFDKDWKIAGTSGIIGDLYTQGSNVKQIVDTLSANFFNIKCDNKIARVDFADFIAEKVKFFGLIQSFKVVPKTKTEYKSLYINALRKGTSEVIKITRLIESEGMTLTEVIGG